jgi:hypothetical protein
VLDRGTRPQAPDHGQRPNRNHRDGKQVTYGASHG